MLKLNNNLTVVCDRCGAELVIASGHMTLQIQGDIKRIAEIAGSQGWTLEADKNAECRQCAIDLHSE